MRSIENKTALIFDLFFSFVFQPILLLIGPAHYWVTQWPVFFVIVCVYLYACYFVLKHLNFPKLLIERRYTRIIVVVLSLIAVCYLLSCYPLPQLDFVIPTLSEYQTQVRNFGVSITLWLMFSLVLGYSFTTSIVKELYDQLLLKRKIEAQRDKAELAMFKAQISPHFLFNTLNSLYSLVIGTSEKAEDAFIKFTELLKYTYVTIDKEWVTLRDDIEYIQNYLDLQSIRLNEHTAIDWSYDVDDDSVQVPPMLFLTFVENAFKYGASTSRDCTIMIHLTLHDGVLRFETRNNVMKHADSFREDMPVGVENCRARLSALYPGRYTLDVSDAGGEFHLNLKIQLDKQPS